MPIALKSWVVAGLIGLFPAVTPAEAGSALAPLRAQLAKAPFVGSVPGHPASVGDLPVLAAAGEGRLLPRGDGYYTDRARCGSMPVSVSVLPLALGPTLPGASAVMLGGNCFGDGRGEMVVLDGYHRRVWSGPASAVAVLPRKGGLASDLAFKGDGLHDQIWRWDPGTKLYDLELGLDDRDFDAEQKSFLWVGPV